MNAPHLGSAGSDTGLGGLLCDHEAGRPGRQLTVSYCFPASCPSRCYDQAMATSTRDRADSVPEAATEVTGQEVLNAPKSFPEKHSPTKLLNRAASSCGDGE